MVKVVKPAMHSSKTTGLYRAGFKARGPWHFPVLTSQFFL